MGGCGQNLSRKEDLVIRFFNLLSRYFKEERSVQYYAELLFVTPKYLTESVKEMTGKTAGEFIDEAVIMEAKILLGTSSLSVPKWLIPCISATSFSLPNSLKNMPV